MTDDIESNQLFDVILKEAGGFGRYQKLLLILSLFVSILAACNHLSPIYLTYTPDYECIEGDSNQIITNITKVQPQCRLGNEACTKWSYDGNVFNSTTVTQFNLICDKSHLLPTIASSYMSGVVVTIIIMGYISDNFGRRTIIIFLSAVHIIFSFVTSFSSNFLMFVMVRFFVGGSIHAVWAAFFVLMAEIVPEHSRVLCGGVLNYGWNIGSLLMTFLAYFIRSWSNLQLSFAFISLVLVSYYFLVPESPRWLISKGQTEEAKHVLKRIAKNNGVKIESTRFNILFEQLVNNVKKNGWSKSGSFSETMSKVKRVLKNKQYFMRLFLMIPPWFAVGMASYGIHFSVQSVSKEMSIFAVAAIKEVIILTMIICFIPIYKRMNRATCVLIFYLIGGTVAISFLIPDMLAQKNLDSGVLENAKVAIYLIAQGLLVADFFMIDTYTPDVFSTDIRNLTFCFLDSISKIGTTISPFIIYVGTITGQTGIPTAIFGAIMVASSFCLLFTPETKNSPLAQTVEELKDSGYPSIFHRLRKNKIGVDQNSSFQLH